MFFGMSNLLRKKRIVIFRYLENEAEEVEAPGGVTVEPLGQPRVSLQLPLNALSVVAGPFIWKLITR